MSNPHLEPAGPQAGRLWVGVLGPPDIRVATTNAHGRPIEIAGLRLRSLLVRLALETGRTVSTSTLVEAIWPEEPPVDTAGPLRTCRWSRPPGSRWLRGWRLAGRQLTPRWSLARPRRSARRTIEPT